MDCSPPGSLSIEFPRQQYWSELPFPPLADLLDPGIEPLSPVSPALAGRFFTIVPPRKPLVMIRSNIINKLKSHHWKRGKKARKKQNLCVCVCVHIWVFSRGFVFNPVGFYQSTFILHESYKVLHDMAPVLKELRFGFKIFVERLLLLACPFRTLSYEGNKIWTVVQKS